MSLIVNGTILAVGLSATGPKALRIDGTYMLAGLNSALEPVIVTLNDDGTIPVNPGDFPVQAANSVFAGPPSGANAAPTFRLLVSDDIPSLATSKITSGTMATARLGSGSASSTTILHGDSTWGSVVAADFGTQAANAALIGPTSGAVAAPTFRALVGTDISVLGTQSIASAASSTLNAINWAASTITITGNTHITTAAGLNYFTIGIPVYSAASALTIDRGATVSILGAPTGGGAGPATITTPLAFWVQSGLARFDGAMYSSAYTSVGITPDSNTPLLIQSTAGSIGIAITGFANGGSEPGRLVFRKSDNSTVHGYLDANTLQLNIHGTNGVVYYADSQNHTFVNGGITLTITPTAINAAIKMNTVASATGGAGFNLPHGTAPSSPVNGDIWTTTAGLFVRINGSTVGPLS